MEADNFIIAQISLFCLISLTLQTLSFFISPLPKETKLQAIIPCLSIIYIFI